MSKADDKVGCVYITYNVCGYGYNGYAESHTCLPKEKSNKQIAEELLIKLRSQDALTAIETLTAALEAKTVHISDEEILERANSYVQGHFQEDVRAHCFMAGARWHRDELEKRYRK